MTRQAHRIDTATTPSPEKAGGALLDPTVQHNPIRRDTARHNTAHCRFSLNSSRLCLAVLISSAAALAQPGLSFAGSNVIVNDALLDSITQQDVPVLPYGARGNYPVQPSYSSPGAVVGTNTDGTPFYVTRPGTLLFPPQQTPRSRVTLDDPGNTSGSKYSFSGITPAPGSARAGSTPPSASGDNAESRLLVPLPPSMSQQPAAPNAVPAKAAPQPPARTTVVQPQAKTPAPAPAPAAPAKQAVPVPAAPAPAAVAAPVPKAPPPPAPAAVVAPPPPKIAPKPLAETSPPKAVPQAALPDKAPPGAPAPTLKETTATLTPPPPPPPPVVPSNGSSAQKSQAAPETTASPTPSAQSASRGDTAAAVSEVQVLFSQDEAALSGPAKLALESVAQTMLANESSEVQLFAYAGQTNIDATQARRLSLSRAMAVRAYLIGKGVRPARMQVRALGNKTTGGSPDRVDIVPAKR